MVKPVKLLGAHVSAAGGPWMAVRNALALGPNARSLAFFIRPHRTWKLSAPFDPQAIARFHQELTHPAKGGGDAIALENVVVHGSYLMNLCSEDATLRRKSVALMLEEVTKCQQLGIQLYVFHPGASKDRASKPKPKKKRKKRSATSEEDDDEYEETAQSKQRHQQSIERLGESMAQVLRATQDVVLVVENMAGQGTLLGATFEELRAILDAAWAAWTSGSPTKQAVPTAARKRLGVCIDTCHAFASGWVMDSDEQCDQMMAHFNGCMGDAWPDVLRVVHVNDSQTACGSRVDRHANIGRGLIGLRAFEWMMNTPHFERVPMILETPRTKKQRKAQQRRRRNANREVEEAEETEESPSSSQSSKRRKRKTEAESESVQRPSATEELETLTQMIR